MALTLCLTRAEEIKLEGLGDGPGFLPFNLGPMTLTTHYHTFLQLVDLKDIDSNIDIIHTQLLEIKDKLDNHMYALYEFQIDHLTNKLDKALVQLKSLEPNRSKRGLVDGLGSIIKSITGNLDYIDAERYEDALKILKVNQDHILTEQNHHISLSKDWMNEHTKIIAKIIDNQSKINETLHILLDAEAYAQYSLLKFAKFAQTLAIVSDNIDSLISELIRLENALAFCHASSMHHSMLSLNIMNSMLGKLRIIYNKDQILDLDNREYYDVIRPASYYNGNQLVFAFRFPIVSPYSYTLYRLAIVPNKNKEIIVPPYPFLAITRDFHVYIEAECPKIRKQYICERNPNHHTRTHPDCICSIIRDRAFDVPCKKITANLMKPAMERLDDRHYTAVFPQSTQVRLTCERDEYNTLTGSFLITIPRKCILRTDDFSIANIHNQIMGQPLKITNISSNLEEAHITPIQIAIQSVNLTKLHHLRDKLDEQHPYQEMHLSTLYHTTIPFYGTIILCILTMVAIALYRRNKNQVNILKKEEIMNHQHSYEDPETSRDEKNIPATFSLKILK
jgi:hypothetical protein